GTHLGERSAPSTRVRGAWASGAEPGLLGTVRAGAGGLPVRGLAGAKTPEIPPIHAREAPPPQPVAVLRDHGHALEHLRVAEVDESGRRLSVRDALFVSGFGVVLALIENRGAFGVLLLSLYEEVAPPGEPERFIVSA